MAAIGGVAPGSIDFDDLYSRVCEKLPFYARPLFLRVGSELEITGTCMCTPFPIDASELGIENKLRTRRKCPKIPASYKISNVKGKNVHDVQMNLT